MRLCLITSGLDCEIDISKSIQNVRAQRSGMVQTEVGFPNVGTSGFSRKVWIEVKQLVLNHSLLFRRTRVMLIVDSVKCTPVLQRKD